MGKVVTYLVIDIVEKDFKYVSINLVNFADTITNSSKDITPLIAYADVYLKDEPYQPVDVVGVMNPKTKKFIWCEPTPEFELKEIQLR